VRSIPLPAYFVAVGALLAAPMLLVKLVLEPNKAEGSTQAKTSVETTVRTPRTTTGTAATAAAADGQSSTDEAARKPSKKAQPRSSHGAVGIARANRQSRYSSYAETTPNRRPSPQWPPGPP